MRVLTAVILFLCLPPAPAHAQSTPPDDFYAPPPLFGAPREPVVIPETPPPAIKEEKTETQIAPKPQIKPAAPISEPKQGVVKRPVTMPVEKKQDVQAEITFEPVTSTPPDMLDRVQIIEEVPEATTSDKQADLSEFTTLDDGGLQLVLLFTEGQEQLDQAQKEKLTASIIPLLSASQKQLTITAYASYMPNKGLNADRRVALSRALAVRGVLLENKAITANQINVQALGSQTSIHPLDRVELVVTP